MSPAVRACIGLGANIGDPVAALLGAFTALAGLPESRVIATSRLYRTPAWGGVEQPDYINAAALLETRLSAQELLRHLLNIEHCAGRRRDAEAIAREQEDAALRVEYIFRGEGSACRGKLRQAILDYRKRQLA